MFKTPLPPEDAQRSFRLTSELVLLTEPDGTICAANPSCERVLGLSARELAGRRWPDVVHPDDRAGAERLVQEHAAEAAPPLLCRHPAAGEEAKVQWRALSFHGWLMLRGVDVTARQQLTERLERSDALWRTVFERSSTAMCLLSLDGRFVEANPQLCRVLGVTPDELTGRKLTEFSPPSQAQETEQGLEAVRRGQTDHYDTEARWIRSSGDPLWLDLDAAPAEMPDGEPRLLVQIVDITQRKRMEAMLDRDIADLLAVQQLRRALAEDRLVLHAQPVVDVETGQTVRDELLLRVRLDHGGELLGPGGFLPTAERLGLVGELDGWVVGRAIELATGGRAVSVNVSVQSLREPAVLDAVEEAIAAGMDPALLGFEISERSLAEELDAAVGFAARARALGCSVAIDDFGACIAGLVPLQRLAGLVSSLKLDADFGRRAAGDSVERHVATTVIELAVRLGLTVVAKGVEDAPTVRRLKRAGVTEAQGYFFERPAPTAIVR